MPKDKNKEDHGISPHNVSSSQQKKIQSSFTKTEAYERNLRVQTKKYSHKEKQGSRTLYMG